MEGQALYIEGHVPHRRICLVLQRGEFAALIGPSGSGKTTLLRALLGHLQVPPGAVTVLGRDMALDPRAARGRLGWMPEQGGIIPGMSGVAMVSYLGELSGMPARDALQRAHEVINYVGLAEERYRAVETFSQGMRQRIKLAQALVHDPDLLILDEINNAVKLKLVDLDQVLQLVKTKPPLMHLVLTGRDAHPKVIELADTVSEIVEIKHAYRKGIEPQPGMRNRNERSRVPQSR